MILTTEQIRAVVSGAVRITEEDGGVRLHRFTEEQHDLYMQTGYRNKILSTPGIRLTFRTDSRTLSLKADVHAASGRTYFAFDVCVNGTLIGSMDNYSDQPLPQNYAERKYQLGYFEKSFDLGEGEKTVSVHLPFSAGSVIREIALDEGASLVPVKRPKKLLLFGDSITHGYDALHPSNRYAGRLADLLDAEEFNKGVGGERFFPPLAQRKEDFVPDWITVAYGTNDWANGTLEEFTGKCEAFYRNLRASYPDTPIFALTPVWRADWETERQCGPFADADRMIAEITAAIPGVYVIHGWDLVPHDPKYFGDLRLHPSDEGFAHYAENLYKAILACIK